VKLRCRLFGHQPGGFVPSGGWPEPEFTLASRCMRCNADTTVVIPSSIEIRRKPREGS